MTEARYKIVFDGQLMPDMALETVKDNLMRLFKSEPGRIDALFGGNPVALKRNLIEGDADKYLAALHRAGARVRKEHDPSSRLSLVETDDHNPAGATPQAGAQMACPKCGAEQAKADSCSACGIIIDKYLARQAQLAESTPALSAEPPTQTPYSPPRADLSEAMPEVGDLQLFTTEGRIGRLRYLAWSMGLLIAGMLLYGVAVMGVAFSTTLGMVLIAAVGIGMLVCSVFFGVQRLHDIGWSGWLYLLQLVPVVGFVMALLMLVVPGRSESNRFGPPPPGNSLGVKLMAAIWLLVPLAALMAVPAYQDYLTRAGM